MASIELSLESQVSGLLTSIVVGFSIFFGCLVLLKAIKVKERLISLYFLMIIFSFTPWYPTAIGYVYWLMTKEALSYEFHVIVGLAFVPIGILAWLDVYIVTSRLKKGKIFMIFYIIFSLIFEIYLFYFLFFAPNAPVESLLASVNELRTTFTGFLLIYSLISVLVVCITGIHFALVSKKSSKLRIQWKGRFLLIANSLFLVLVVLDSIIPSALILAVIVVRILLIVSIFLLYLGAKLPNWVKKLLSIEE